MMIEGGLRLLVGIYGLVCPRLCPINPVLHFVYDFRESRLPAFGCRIKFSMTKGERYDYNLS